MAGGHLRHALAGMKEIGSPRGEAEALMALGSLAERAGRPGEARLHYAAAQEILVRMGSRRVARVRERLARLGDAGQE